MRISAQIKKLLAVVFFIYMCSILCSASEKIISTDSEAQVLLIKAKAVLKEKLEMEINLPVIIKVVPAPELDSMIPESPYKGREVGIYKFEGTYHLIYLMKDFFVDLCYGTVAHELTHAWQQENCPDQSLALKEGLAVWIQYKTLQWDGAYYYANELNEYTQDPVYGQGYRFIQKLEDKLGEANVLTAVKKLKDIPFSYSLNSSRGNI